MNRRGFLSSLSAALAGATLDPDKLLWRLGAKFISIPSPRPRFQLARMGGILVEDLKLYEKMRGEWEFEFYKRGYKLGDTMQIRRPLTFSKLPFRSPYLSGIDLMTRIA